MLYDLCFLSSVCHSGKFNCTNECPVVTCAANQVWKPTGKECARTCSNLHVPCLAKDSKAGCRCEGNLAWDETKKKCVHPWQCPCHYQGRSYPEGSKFKHDCNEWLVTLALFAFYFITLSCTPFENMQYEFLSQEENI